MSELISGKEALIELANGEDVEYFDKLNSEWDEDTSILPINVFTNGTVKFRLKPRTITINGIEVPAPFDPKDGEKIWLLSDMHNNGYMVSRHENDFIYAFGAWRTEEEIKQVVAELRSIFSKK